MLHNDSMIQQFISLYLVQCPIDFQVLAESMEQKDPIAISSAAHHIKPTMAYIGATELKMKLQELEDLGNQNAAISTIIDRYQKINTMYTRLMEELAFFQNTRETPDDQDS